jgi:hypothetical protein
MMIQDKVINQRMSVRKYRTEKMVKVNKDHTRNFEVLVIKNEPLFLIGILGEIR